VEPGFFISLPTWVRWKNGDDCCADAQVARYVKDPSSRIDSLSEELESEVEPAIDCRGIEADAVVCHNEPCHVPFTR
jgi:hypothetical protein